MTWEANYWEDRAADHDPDIDDLADDYVGYGPPSTPRPKVSNATVGAIVQGIIRRKTVRPIAREILDKHFAVIANMPVDFALGAPNLNVLAHNLIDDTLCEMVHSDDYPPDKYRKIALLAIVCAELAEQ